MDSLTEQGIIQNIELKTSRNAKQYCVLTIDGRNYTSWNNSLWLNDKFKKGMFVNITYEKNGNYNNLVSIEEAKQEQPQTNSMRQFQGPTIGMAINNAANYVKDSSTTHLSPEEYSVMVVDYAVHLLSEMKRKDLA